MYFGANTFLFIILMLVCLYFIAKISNIFRLNHKLSVFIMVLTVVCIGFLYQYLYFLKINDMPENGESYRIKEANFYYSFSSDGSADVEQKLMFQPNKNTASNKSLSYIFYEPDTINSLEIILNNDVLKHSDTNAPNTYKIEINSNSHVLTVYLPYNNKEFEYLNLNIKYSIKHALLKSNGILVYYNTFFPERSDFSYNTNVKGKVIFNYPDNSLINIASNSNDFYLNVDKENPVSISFENKIPYEKYLFSKFSNWIKLYDPASFDKSYIKDFSLITRLNFSPEKFNKSLNSNTNTLNVKSYSISELKSLNEENNKKYSDIKFMLGVFATSFSSGIGLFLFISSPFIYSHYKRKKEGI